MKKKNYTLYHVREEWTNRLKTLKITEDARIGYVSGVINSDGEKHIERNKKNLKLWTE